MATKKKAPTPVVHEELVDKKGWKYFCNDEAVTEAVFLQVQQDHALWIIEQEKAAVAKAVEEAKLDKKVKKPAVKKVVKKDVAKTRKG